MDLIFLKNPVLRLLDRLNLMDFSFAVAKFAKQRMGERLAEMSEKKAAGIDEFSGRRGDLLSMFLKAKEDCPDFMTAGRVLTMAVSMAFAGSETTAISLAAVFYFLLKNPRCYHKLMTELDTAVKDGTIADRPNGLVLSSAAAGRHSFDTDAA